MQPPALDGNCRTNIFIGCAGWSVPGTMRAHFPSQGSQLERYAAVLPAVEINSSFYRPHKPETYARWRDSVPAGFRFSVKMPRAITHQARLRQAAELLALFLTQVNHLGEKLGCLLVQLPPSLRFDASGARNFFAELRGATSVPVACEPRHVTWFDAAAVDLLGEFRIARVTADPPIIKDAAPAIEVGTAYFRLHGSPLVYHSSYAETYLDTIAAATTMQARAGRQVWCIFDNTASGAAMPNAFSLLTRVAPLRRPNDPVRQPDLFAPP